MKLQKKVIGLNNFMLSSSCSFSKQPTRNLSLAIVKKFLRLVGLYIVVVLFIFGMWKVFQYPTEKLDRLRNPREVWDVISTVNSIKGKNMTGNSLESKNIQNYKITGTVERLLIVTLTCLKRFF